MQKVQSTKRNLIGGKRTWNHKGVFNLKQQLSLNSWQEIGVIRNELRRGLKDNPEAKVRIAGYTSAFGTDAYNQKLSERRANAVKEYLINEGLIARDRLSIIGNAWEQLKSGIDAAMEDLGNAYKKAAAEFSKL